MSGMNEGRDRDVAEVPPVLQHLSESSREWQPSVRVEEALRASWDARGGPAAAGMPLDSSSTAGAAPWRWAPWGALAACLLASLVWWGVTDRVGTAPVANPVQAGAGEAVVDEPAFIALGPAESSARGGAVPSGPFEPPPSPRPSVNVPRQTAPPVSAGRQAPRLAGRVVPASPTAPQVQPEESDPFVWLPAAEPIEPGLGMQVVRVTLPHARWDGRAPGQDAVQADVLMGDDGMARAVRVVRTSARQ